MPEQNGQPHPPSAGDGGDIDVLADPTHFRQDCRLVRRAVRSGWPIGPRKRRVIVDRLMSVVEKTSVEIPTATGSFASEAHADGNAVSAARTLASMHWHNLTEQGKVSGSGAVTIVVHNENRIPNPRQIADAPPGTEEGDPGVKAVQRFDVRQTLGEDDAG